MCERFERMGEQTMYIVYVHSHLMEIGESICVLHSAAKRAQGEKQINILLGASGD